MAWKYNPFTRALQFFTDVLNLDTDICFNPDIVDDFLIKNESLDKKIIFNVNDGGVQKDLLELDANGTYGFMETKINSVAKIADGTIGYPQNHISQSLKLLKVGGIVSDVNVSVPQNSTIDTTTTWNYTARPTSAFSQTTGIIGAATSVPIGTGGGNHNTAIRGGNFDARWDANSSGGTLLNVQGVSGLALAQGNGGTVKNCIGGNYQSGGLFGNANIKNCASIQSTGPFRLAYTGIITTGYSIRSIGGVGALINWNLSCEGASTPSKFEGKLSIGHTVQPSYACDATEYRVRSRGNFNLGGITAFDRTFAFNSPSSGVISFFGIGGSNNENLTIDTEAVANEVKFSSTSGADLFLDFNLQRQIPIPIDSLRKGSTAPTEVLRGTTPSVPALNFSSTAELVSTAFAIPENYAGGDVTIHLWWALSQVQVNLDQLDITMDYITVDNLDNILKTSSPLVRNVTVTTPKLAIGDVYEMAFTLAELAAGNTIGAGKKIIFEIHLRNTTGVAEADLIEAHAEYITRN